MNRVRVTLAHRASYPDPIRLGKGDKVTLTGREDNWDGHRWLWAIAPDGREGWVPDRLVSAQGHATVDYEATELTCAGGEVLKALSSTHGWVWCCNINGAQGWVPARHLTSS